MVSWLVSVLFRASDIRVTVAQQIMFKSEDIREMIYKFTDSEAVTEDTIDEATEVFASLAIILSSVDELLGHEMSMNWLVV